MDMGSMNTFMDVIVLGCGIYIIWMVYLAKYKGDIKQSLIWRRTTPPDRCRDKAGFAAYLFPRFTLLGILLILSAVLSMVNHSVNFFPQFEIVTFVVTIVVIVLYCVFDSKATKDFYD